MQTRCFYSFSSLLVLLQCPVYEALENVEGHNGLGDGDGVPRVSNRHQPQILYGFYVARDLPVRTEYLILKISDINKYFKLFEFANEVTSFGVV